MGDTYGGGFVYYRGYRHGLSLPGDLQNPNSTSAIHCMREAKGIVAIHILIRWLCHWTKLKSRGGDPEVHTGVVQSAG